MKIQIGYEFSYDFPQVTPIILTTNVHYSRASDIVIPDHLTAEPPVAITAYRDGFGNWCNRIVAPAGRNRFSARGVLRDTAKPDVVAPFAVQHAVQDLPEETLVFLLGSRYCETDQLNMTDPEGNLLVSYSNHDFLPAHVGLGGLQGSRGKSRIPPAPTLLTS